ncbi:6-phospho-beta-glucosidase [Vibrio sp. TRT 17S01]|uniref:6-phospho-beta-glucosidase n=1 Tax=Vibrio sp. TRT 17S01 TaxID=3418505 RepID=UPI003CFA98DD
MNHIFQLVDGVVLNGELQKRVTVQPLDGEQYAIIEKLVNAQLSQLEAQPNFHLVNESHRLGLKGYMMLHECAATSISHIGDVDVDMVFHDWCQLNVSAQDWSIILSANLAVSEFYGDTEAGSMSA